ncbi:MAG: phosphatidate cytidylyltransferase [Bacteroidales bacterium]|nr:phosphatidate cytidylyltransferase [Bacteroidales bacterium]
MNIFVKRTLSGAVFVAIMLAGLLINKWLFGILVSLMAAGMLYEYLRVPEKSSKHKIIGVIYILLGMVALNALAFLDGEWSGIPVLCVLIMIWGTDVGGYCIGSSLGKNSRKLAPEISPHKTWAGFWGGLVCCVAAAVILCLTGLLELPLIVAIVLGVLVHFSGVTGDLIESMWKRRVGIKDSGTIIPGHGGLLDRFDSTLLASYAAWMFFLIYKLVTGELA